MKKYFILLILLAISLVGISAIIPMPLPMQMYHTNSSGTVSNQEVMAIWLSVNAFCIFVVLIRSIVWVIKKLKNANKHSYFEYSIYSDDLMIPGFNSIAFIVINIIAIITMLTVLILSWF